MREQTVAEIKDETLAKQCAEGSNRAREMLYKKYAARVYMLCIRYLGDPVLAKDLAQDCFIRIYDVIRKYDPDKSSLKTWISHVAVNYVIDYLRHKRRLSFVKIDEQVLNIQEQESEDYFDFVSQDVILKMISNLPDTKRIVFNMYCLEEYSHKEIADMLGIKEKTSSSLLFKARTQLSEMLNAYKKEINE